MGNRSSVKGGDASAPSSGDDFHAAVRQTQSTLERIVSQNVAPGISYAAIDGTGSSSISVGCADAVAPPSRDHEVDANTHFMAYSITKTITAILILQLAERHLLRLDDSVSGHLPPDLLQSLPTDHYLNAHGEDVTIRMLLDHTSGIPNPMPLDWFFVTEEDEEGTSPPSLREKRQEAFLDVLTRTPKLKFTPGSDRMYSNVGYWILEKVIEHVTGKSYSDVFVEQIAGPLGLEGNRSCEPKLTFDVPAPRDGKGHQKPVLAQGHSPGISIQTLVFYLLTLKSYWSARGNIRWRGHTTLVPHGLGYGGMYASVAGLQTILSDLLINLDEETSASADRGAGVLLSLQSKREMFGMDNSNPLGWARGNVVVEGEQEPYFTKPGGGLGFHGNIRIYPRLGLSTVYLCNGTCVSAGQINGCSDSIDMPILTRKRRARAEEDAAKDD